MKKRQIWQTHVPEGEQSPLDVAIVERDKNIVDAVAAAVMHDNAALAFQPVVQASATTSVAFYEGYIRVMDSTGRVIPAREFMHIIEERELGRKLDCLALEHGLDALLRNPGIRTSVNMSARSIGYGPWINVLERYLKRDKYIGERLVLEIAETSAMAAPDIMIDFMDRMQEHGTAFALDNFGAGYTVIGNFRDFFFDAVKIDGKFIRGLHNDHANQAVVRSLIAIAKQFDMFVVAESVENEDDAAFLIDAGVDCMQGFLYGVPTTAPPWEETRETRSRA